MEESRYIMVRLDRTTHKRLCAVRDSLMIAHEQGKLGLEVDNRDRVSLDQIINILIDARVDHARRRKASAKRRRGSLASNVDTDSTTTLPAIDKPTATVPG